MTRTNRVAIYDTTLRDGAQGMGISFSTASKLRLVRKLDKLGVDYIEGGYAGSGKRDMEFFKQVRKETLTHSKIAAFGSTRRAKTKASSDAGVANLLEANTPVVTIFGKAWKLHVKDVLRTTAKENLAMIADTVQHLKKKGKEVIFDAEHFFDGFKDSPAFATAAIEAAVSAGCDTVVLCDTNGGCLPDEVYEMTLAVASHLSVPVGIHTHNDAGMAAANSLAAVRGGAVQVQGTMNGYGERCGNADLCTVVPNLILKMDKPCLLKDSLAGLRDASQFVAELVNLRHNGQAPYVGKHAFSHKAGMHVDAVKKNPMSFEHITPAAVGNERSILLSEGSGRSSVLLKAIELGVVGVKGVDKSSGELGDILQALKTLESKGYAFEAADASFQILVQKVLREHKAFFELEGFRVTVEKRGKDEPCLSEATIKVRVKDEVEHTVGEGIGPVEALDQALRKALIRFYPEIANVILTDFRVRILDPEESTAATTRVLIESTDGEASWGTVGVSENIIEACWEALVDSVEYKLFRDEKQKTGKKPKSRAKRPKR
jgi:2-isopropylmalate synthase